MADLQQGVCMFQEPAHHSVTGFVIRYSCFLWKLENMVLFLQA